jgi:hypothetical protein
MAEKPNYRTIDLSKAIAFGWTAHHDLNAAEIQVFMFMAARGKTNEEGMAFAWFPMGGQEWWAAQMGMTIGRLKKALVGLRKRRMVVNMEGSTATPLYGAVKGYGVPEGVMYNAYQWYKEREDIRFLKAPKDASSIVNDSDGILNDSDGIVDDSDGIVGTPSELGFRDTYPCNKPGENTQLFTQSTPPSGSHSVLTSKKDLDVKYEDEWSVPKDAKPVRSKKPPVDEFLVPKDSHEGKVRPTSPVKNLADEFYAQWTQAREVKTMLPVPWSSKQAFYARMKDLLGTHSEEQIIEMFKTFFRMVLAGRINPKGNELWKDFWNNRASIATSARMSTKEVPADQQTELENWRKKIRR